MKQSLVALLFVAAFVGCNKPAAQATQADPAAAKDAATATSLPPGHPPMTSNAMAAQPPNGGNRLTGKVAETMNAAGYTYIKLATPSGEQWAAVREAPVKKGDSVTVVAEMTMDNFESKTLGRKFDHIVFGALAGSGNGSAMPAGHPQTGKNVMGGPAEHMSSGAAMQDIKVAKAEGGKSVAEIWAGRKALEGQTVILRAKVVKFLPGIMSRNWMHLRDGTGSHGEGNDDITVTTHDIAAVGDVVTVKGTVHIDKDFGAGYEYGVIIEDATVK